MINRVMAIYDTDPFYAERFSEYVSQKAQIPFAVMAFTDFERLKAYGEEHPIELLLISSSVNQEEIEKTGAVRVILLSEGETNLINEAYRSIYKYQEAGAIIREIMGFCCEEEEKAGHTVLSKKSRVIGVYSPVNRCLKTSFSLTMGQLMARDSKVLYLSLEDCSGLKHLTGEEYKGGLSDLLYYFSQGQFCPERIGSVVYTWGDMDYVPPVSYPDDLLQITTQRMAEFITRISRESSYELIILDLGQFGKKAADVLESCDVIYMPVKDDCISVAKIEEFENYMKTSGHEAVKTRIQKIKLPYHNNFGHRDNYLEQLLWGELGDFTRQLLRKQP